MFTVDLVGAEKVAVRLNDFPPKLRSEMRPRLVDAGNITANDMRRRAGSSTRIPGAIYVRPRFAAGPRQGVLVGVDYGKAPHAYVHAKTNPFKHKVWGVWRTGTPLQTPLNYWDPAIRAGGHLTRLKMADAIRAAAHDR